MNGELYKKILAICYKFRHGLRGFHGKNKEKSVKSVPKK